MKFSFREGETDLFVLNTDLSHIHTEILHAFHDALLHSDCFVGMAGRDNKTISIVQFLNTKFMEKLYGLMDLLQLMFLFIKKLDFCWVMYNFLKVFIISDKKSKCKGTVLF